MKNSLIRQPDDAPNDVEKASSVSHLKITQRLMMPNHITKLSTTLTQFRDGAKFRVGDVEYVVNHEMSQTRLNSLSIATAFI